MKNLSLILLALIAAPWSFAQQNPINFETGGFGATWTWNVFENGPDPQPALEFVANPSATGINTSATVAKFTAKAAGQRWAGTETAHGSPLGSFSLSASTSVIKIMVYKSKISDVGIKLATAAGGSKGEIKVANTKINEWEELTFDFTAQGNLPDPYDQVIVFPDFIADGTTRTDNIAYFDNITFNAAGVAPSAPTAAAPTPTKAATDVISMFSNAYTNVPVDTWRTDWSPAVVLTDLQVAGNDTKKYDMLQYVGIETNGANQLNLASTGMTHFHIDVWSPNFDVFRVKLVDYGANATNDAGGDDKEHEVIYNAPAKGQWVSLDIPLSDFVGLTTKSNIAQLILSGTGTGGNTVYVDNVYFHKTVAAPTAPTAAAPIPPNRLPVNVISLFSNRYTNVPVTTWRTDWSAATLTDLQVAGNDTKKYSNLDFVGIETTGADLINATNMTYFHVDVWSPDFTEFAVKLVDFGANGVYQGSPNDDVEHQLNYIAPTKGEWVSYDIPLANFTGLTTKAHLAQIILVGRPAGASNVFVDNMYFHNNIITARDAEELPQGTTLEANYPNPFTQSTTFKYTLAQATNVQFEVMDGLGRIVEKVAVGLQTAGTHEFLFEKGQLSSGVYFLRLKTDAKQFVQKFTIMN